MGKSTYVDPIVIRTTKWKKKLVENPIPSYPVGKDTVFIADTTQFQDIPLVHFANEVGIPFAVNDSAYELPITVRGEYQGWLKGLEVETQNNQFVYEIKLKKQVDWKWTILAFTVGALAMRAADALTD